MTQKKTLLHFDRRFHFTLMSREQVFVTGHRNPDMDSICSSWSYARLKNAVDPTRMYIPIRGHMNDITKAQFSRLGIKAPMYVQNIKPRVFDIMSKPEMTLQLKDSIFSLANYFADSNSPVIPIFDGEKFHTMLSVEQITNYFLKTSASCSPLFEFDLENIEKSLTGVFLKKGAQTNFKTTINIGFTSLNGFKESLKGANPLPLCMLGPVVEIIEHAAEQQVPFIILIGFKNAKEVKVDFSHFEGTVFLSTDDTDKTLQMLKMSVPLRVLLDSKEVPSVNPNDYFDDVKEFLPKSGFRALPVIDDDGKFVGIINRNSFITKPKRKLIMMDHNEKNQGIPGIEDCEIMEIIDHHRLAADKTQTPIFMDVEPLGSTCTIVYQLYRKHDVEIDRQTALVLLSGICNDTVILRSPTTTQTDKEVVHKLVRVAGVENLQEFGQTMFSGGASITTQDARKLILADFKMFDECNVKFGIGQCEVTQFQGVDDIKEKWIQVLEDVKRENNIQLAIVVITNIIDEDSIMLTTPFPKLEKNIKYKKDSEGKYLCPGVLSRKIQILPEIIRVLSNDD